jgi:hypothetical protein
VVVDPKSGARIAEEEIARRLSEGADHPVLNRIRTWMDRFVGLFSERGESVRETAQRLQGEWAGKVRGGQTALRPAAGGGAAPVETQGISGAPTIPGSGGAGAGGLNPAAPGDVNDKSGVQGAVAGPTGEQVAGAPVSSSLTTAQGNRVANGGGVRQADLDDQAPAYAVTRRHMDFGERVVTVSDDARRMNAALQVRRRRSTTDPVMHATALRVAGLPEGERLGLPGRPGSWYVPDSTTAWVRDQEQGASDDALLAEMRATKARVESPAGEADRGAAAGAILINRLYGRWIEAQDRARAAQAAGKPAEAAAAQAEAERLNGEIGGRLDELEVVGLHAGRLVQQFSYLRAARPEAQVEMVRRALAKDGLALSDKDAARLKDVVARNLGAGQALVDAAEAWRAAPSESTAAVRDQAAERAEVARADYRDALRVLPRKPGSMFVTRMQMGLMDTISVGKNTLGNALFVLPRMGTDVLAAAMDIGVTALERGYRRVRGDARPVARQYLSGVGDLGRVPAGLRVGLAQAGRALRTGESPIAAAGEGRADDALRPWKALVEFWTGENIPVVAQRNGETRRSRQAMAARAVEGTLGVYAATISRLMQATDLPFRSVGYAMALSNLGRERGLSGEALARFVEDAPADARKEADERARFGVYQQKSVLSNATLAFLKAFEKSPTAYALMRGLLPFAMTPANVQSEAIQMFGGPASIVAGTWMAAQGKVKGSREVYRAGLRLAAKGGVGMTMLAGAAGLAALGVLSGRPPDEKKRKMLESTVGVNRLNRSGLGRAIDVLRQGGTMDEAQAAAGWRDGDKTVRFGSLGFPGLAMSIWANAEESYAKALTAQNPWSQPSFYGSLAGNLVKATLELPMLQSLDEFYKAVADGRRWPDFFARYAATLASAVVPRAGKGITDVQSTWLLESGSGRWADEAQNRAYRERVWPLAKELPLARDYWGRRIPTVPADANPWLWRFGDVLQTGTVRMDAVDAWVKQQYDRTGDMEYIPAIPHKGRYFTWPDAAAARRAGVQQQVVAIEAPEYERLLKRVGVLRLKGLENLLGAPAFARLTPERQKRLVANVYEDALEIGEQMLLEDRSGRRLRANRLYRAITDAAP